MGVFGESKIGKLLLERSTWELYFSEWLIRNGYSSQLDLNHANKELMYCVGDSGQEGYLPKNAAFTLTDEEKNAEIDRLVKMIDSIMDVNI